MGSQTVPYDLSTRRPLRGGARPIHLGRLRYPNERVTTRLEELTNALRRARALTSGLPSTKAAKGRAGAIRRLTPLTLRLTLGICLLAVLGASGAIDWTRLAGLFTAWQLTLAAVLIIFAAHFATGSRLCILLRPFDLRLTLAASFRLSLIATFFNFCLPGATGGDLLRMYYATEGNPGRRTEVVTILMIDRFIGLFGLLLWPLLISPLFPVLVGSLDVLRWLLWAAALIALAMLVVFFVGLSGPVRTSRPVTWAVQRLPMGGHVNRVMETVRVYQRLPGTLVASVGVSLLAHTLAIVAMLVIASAINPLGFAWQMSLLIPLGIVANAVPITPGGLGVGETAFNHLFEMVGLTGGAEVLLGWRALTIGTGLLGLAFYLQGRRQIVHASTTGAAPLGQLALHGVPGDLPA
jgi:glycosyltransferase 2 family protein